MKKPNKVTEAAMAEAASMVFEWVKSEPQSVLQQQAAKCREAQKNLDEAKAAYDKDIVVVNDIETKIQELYIELRDAQEQLRASSLIHRYAGEAVELSINEMHRTLDNAMPYGASRAMTEQCVKESYAVHRKI